MEDQRATLGKIKKCHRGNKKLAQTVKELDFYVLYSIHYLNSATTAKYAGRIGACRSLNISNSPIAISA